VVSDRASLVVTRHRLPVEWFDILSAGSGSQAITRFFWKTERSRRLLLINTLLYEVDQHPSLLGPLPPASGLWSILTSAQAARPSEFDELLLHPHVGNAAAFALRRHRRGASGDLPLWTDFGGIHALALVAAARAGLSWSTRIPVRAGYAMLPTLGMAQFSGSATASFADARTEGGQIWLWGSGRQIVVPAEPSTDADGWWGLRQLQVGDDLRLKVWLDDLDPFRDLADPVPPVRLDQSGFDRWRVLLTDAWALLCRDHRANAEAMADGVVSLVPLPPEPGWETRSASNGEAFGSVMVSEPPDAVTLAVSLVHEFQHIKLGALIHLLPLTEDEDGSHYYAPWRDDPRPLAGLIQGVYAFFGIAEFWGRHRLKLSGPAADLAGFEYAYAKAQTEEALQIVLAAKSLTANGRRLTEGLLASLATSFTDSLPAKILRLSKLTADSHRVGWRLRHFQPDSSEVLSLAKAFHNGDSAEAASPPKIHPHPELRWPQQIPKLARQQILATAHIENDETTIEWDMLKAADHALVAGDLDVARKGYLESAAAKSAVTRSHDELRAWVGLALTAAGDGDSSTAVTLTVRPDLVRAVYTEVATISPGANPIDVAAWLVPAIVTERT